MFSVWMLPKCTDKPTKISKYFLNNVTYDTASAAYMAIRSLHEIAYPNIKDYPRLFNIMTFTLIISSREELQLNK